MSAFNRLEIKPEQISAIGEDLESSKIIIEGIDYFKSEQSITLFKEINLLIDQLLSIDFIVNTKPTGGFVNAEYLRNNKGFINNYTISKGDVSSWISLLRKYSADSDLCIINRLAFLRKYIELDIENEKQKQKLGYEIISSLQHGYSTPQVKTGGEFNDMKEDQIQSGIEYLCEFIGDFNYQTILSDIKSEDKIKSYYESHENNYLKLQVFRASLEVLGKRDQLNDKHLIKFIDETYHVENDYIYSLDLMKYEIVPDYIIESCDKFIFN